MPRLIVNPGTSTAREIQLQRGITTLGRSEENHFTLDDPSVSSAHFEVSVTNSGAVLRDLGSTNGTFVEGTRIEEVILLPGQSLKAGEVLLRYEADYGIEEAPTPNAKTAPTESGFCFSHPKRHARFLCPKCKKLLCAHCVARKRCVSCWVECMVLDSPVSAPRQRMPFAKQIPGAFAYPLKGDGLILLIGGSVFFGVIGFAARLAFVFGLALQIFLAGYLIVYAREILRSSADGEDQMPPWPDVERISEYRTPIFEFYGTLLFCFAPAILFRFLHWPAEPWHTAFLWGSVLLGCLYLPVALTGVTMFDSINGVNPILVIPSILRIPLQSLLASGALGLGVGASVLADLALQFVAAIPLLPALVSGALQIYFLAVAMRIFGLLYRSEEEKLGWFSTDK